eukprot:TRINITY_DN8742_c0_g1_i1.p1 TRINITY_DN8742_c0_g1~~TRINITY_DN8742_c0_g1_i1.p1  ORF type:complete len:260 (+),score=35.41 TRINITY_DN8742_c0_g1_i1:117-896(+)
MDYDDLPEEEIEDFNDIEFLLPPAKSFHVSIGEAPNVETFQLQLALAPSKWNTDIPECTLYRLDDVENVNGSSRLFKIISCSLPLSGAPSPTSALQFWCDLDRHTDTITSLIDAGGLSHVGPTHTFDSKTTKKPVTLTLLEASIEYTGVPKPKGYEVRYADPRTAFAKFVRNRLKLEHAATGGDLDASPKSLCYPCANGACPKSGQKRCVQCKKYRYCSVKCQREHWKVEHKEHCGAARRAHEENQKEMAESFPELALG